MKKLSNYSEKLVYDAHEKVLKVSVTTDLIEKKDKEIAVASKKPSRYIARRYSFDNNGGGYQGL